MEECRWDEPKAGWVEVNCDGTFSNNSVELPLGVLFDSSRQGNATWSQAGFKLWFLRSADGISSQVGSVG